MLRQLKAAVLRWWDSRRYDSVTIATKFRNQGAKIGENCFFQIRDLAAEPYLVEIGNNVSIAMGVRLFTHDGASVVFRNEYPSLRYYGRIVIEDDSFIGEGAVLTPGVRIGRQSIIGARAVVIGDVKPGSVMVGNPAFRVSSTEKYKEKCLAIWKTQKLDEFENLFQGKDKFEVQETMITHEFRQLLRNHLTAVLSESGRDGNAL